MKRYILVFLFLVSFVLLYSQEVRPLVHLKPVIAGDSVAVLELFKSNDSVNVYADDVLFGVNFINHNLSLSIDEEHEGFSLFVENANVEKLTIIVVYQSNDNVNESMVWGVNFDDNRKQMLTTTNYFASVKSFKYKDDIDKNPVINSAVFSLPKYHNDTLLRVDFFNNDTLPFVGYVSEILIFDQSILAIDLQKYQTYLAIKYGVSLIDKDYINSIGDSIWYVDSEFNKNIAGISFDTTFSLYQNVSHSSIDDIISISLENDIESNLMNYNFSSILWADNGFEIDATEIIEDIWNMPIEVLKRRWKLFVSGTWSNSDSFSLKFDGNDIGVQPHDECNLIIARRQEDFYDKIFEIIYPDSIGEDGFVYFSGIQWDTDGSGEDFFTFGIQKAEVTQTHSSVISIDDNNSQENKKILPTDILEEPMVSVYPNPSKGLYHLDIRSDIETKFDVEIYNSMGSFIKSYEVNTALSNLKTDTISVSGIYYVVIKSNSSNAVFKLVIN